MRRLWIPIVAGLVFVFAWADGNRVNTTDREVKVNGEKLCDSDVQMSCRFGTMTNAGKVGQYITAQTAFQVTTLGQNLPVYVFKNNPDLCRLFQQFHEKDEVTIFGKVVWSQQTGSYVLANGIQKGFSLDYDASVPAPQVVTIDVSGVQVALTLGETKPIACPHCQTQLLVKWDK